MSFEFEGVNQFFQEVSQDPELQLQFQSVTDRESLVDKAVVLGKEKNYSFSSTEVSEWLESMTAQHQNQSDTSGELSDSELEAVAGAGALGAGAGGVLGGVLGFIGAIFTGKDPIEEATKGAIDGASIGARLPI
ncbi:Nif11-like leader peptide family natural product precursor [Microcoleus sp. herbarium12]|uniref:Nif11-like leader peptide family natural product precursor n=1 Tax=Microcoleus sp. herbarium12 TaxID=3055437 RepID=UPI002FD48C49